MSGLDGQFVYHDIRVKRIEDRISRIWTCIAAGLAAPHVGDIVEQLRRWEGCGPRDFRCLGQLGHYTINALIKYTPDPPDVDLFKSFEVVRLEAQKEGRGKGDCGTFTAALATVLAWWGFEVGCDVIAQSPFYDHVFNRAWAPGLGSVCFDASVEPVKPAYWEPPPSKYHARRTFWLRNRAEWVAWWRRGARNEDMPSI